MDSRGARIPALCLASALFACAGRKPLAGGDGRIPADGGVSAIDAGADGATSQDGSPAPSSFQTIDDMDHATGLPEGSSAFFWPSPNTTGIGNWFVSWSDGSTMDARIDAIDPPRGESTKACHVTSAEIGRSADLWAQLDHPSARAVDLSGYDGIAFWARLAGAGGRLVVAINDRNGGTFTAQASGSPLPTKALAVSQQWQRFIVRFDDLGVQPTAVVSIDFVVAGDAEAFDLWIDDLALGCRGTCP